jgi:glycine dehydrogenase
MLRVVGYDTLDALIDDAVPRAIRMNEPLALTGCDRPRGEQELLGELRQIAGDNQRLRSLIGLGYFGTITPPVIQRNILENPGWYTQYTPYQPEIAQGRLEALLNFQTMVADLTGLPLANASLLDEPTAAAEAMSMCIAIGRGKRNRFFIADHCHPQTLAVVRTRAKSMGVNLTVGSLDDIELNSDTAGVLVQYPTSDGRVLDYNNLAQRVHDAGAMFVVASDLLALALLKPPGEFGADIAIGSAQRFGVPMGFGGPHAAFMSTSEKHVRKMPGRLVGVSIDAEGRKAFRLAIQTREQHIKRDKATSNICTAQVLLAIMAGMYGVYHGPQGIRQIARRVHAMTAILAHGLKQVGYQLGDDPFFDTLRIRMSPDVADHVVDAALRHGVNLRRYPNGDLGVSLDELTDRKEVDDLLSIFTPGAADGARPATVEQLEADVDTAIPQPFARQSDFMTHEVFDRFHSETEMLRYMYRLQQRDLSLATAAIPLGSCTMKLNGTSEMLPITWPQFADIHPFVPEDQTQGYQHLCGQLETWLAEITGFDVASLQPNAGSQGEYAGLLAIRGYHEANGQAHRDVCLIPVSAHGTNPASAVIAGLKIVTVDCDPNGNIDIADLKAKAEQHADRLAALMITYPSTHGVFEEGVMDICSIIHDNGGQVYMDGANLNAMVGLARVADIGADVCHINLHKTFCIPHGGGGPGMGPIAAAKHLAPHMPKHPHEQIGAVSGAPFGSASILPISWMYIALMAGEGLTRATKIAILSANYMAERIKEHYPVLFTGHGGRVAHEFIMDCRQLRIAAGVEIDDIAKRLMDYGFHAPTMSWPVAGTLMIEPTESESKFELDRLIEALIAIRAEAREIELGRADIDDNVLKHAPHTATTVSANIWPRPYPRELGAFPTDWVRENKYWPPVSRIDNPHGDRNLVCTCPPMEEYTSPDA